MVTKYQVAKGIAAVLVFVFLIDEVAILTLASLGIAGALAVVAIAAVVFVLLLRTSWGRRRLDRLADKVDRRL